MASVPAGSTSSLGRRRVCPRDPMCQCCACRWGIGCRMLGFTPHPCPVNVDSERTGFALGVRVTGKGGPAARSAVGPTRMSPVLWGRHGRATEFPPLSSDVLVVHWVAACPTQAGGGLQLGAGPSGRRGVRAPASSGSPGAAPLSPQSVSPQSPRRRPSSRLFYAAPAVGTEGPCGLRQGKGTSGPAAAAVSCWSEGAGGGGRGGSSRPARRVSCIAGKTAFSFWSFDFLT